MQCGIDFGTLYSSVSCYDRATGQCLPVPLDCEGGMLRLRSAVFFPETGGPVMVGRHACNAGRLQPERLISDIKRHMGQGVTFPVSAEGALSPRDVAAHIFRTLRDEVSRHLGEVPSGAVISVPVWFEQVQRQDTLDAAVLAGFDSDEVSLIDQPQAVVLAHIEGCVAEGAKDFAVFDLGADLDLAVIRVEGHKGAATIPTSYELVASGGARGLGGPAWDSRIAHILAERLREAAGTDPTVDPEDRLELLQQAENAKLILSREVCAVAIFPSTMQEIEVTRADLEDATADLLREAQAHLERVIADAYERYGVSPEDMTLISCGGCAVIPSVLNMLTKTMGREQTMLRDVETIGARGAALWGYLRDSQSTQSGADRLTEAAASDQPAVSSIELCGRSSYCVGIELRDEDGEKYYKEVLVHGVPYGEQHAVSIPCIATHNNMPSIQVPLASCTRAHTGSEGWVRLGTLTAGPLPDGVRRDNPISVRLWFDENGILRGDVTDEKSGLSLSATLDRGETGTGRQRVQRFAFSAFYPERIPMGTTGRLLAYAHIESQAEEVVSQVASRLKPARDVRIKAGSVSKAIPMRSHITVVPDIVGLEFDRYEATMSLWEDVQSVEFRFQAEPRSACQTCEGWIHFWLEGMPLADIPVSIWVGETDVPDVYKEALARANARPYRAVFPSYSHKDAEIVKRMEVYSEAFGDEYLRDIRSLRSGQSWNKQILRFIGQADVFQLFWSENAASSEYVEQEWRRALSERELRPDPHFLRPVYWAERPTCIPEELRKLHFARLPL